MAAYAGEFSPWEVRARFVRLDAKGESDAIPALGLPSNAVNVHSVSLPEVDISYFFTKSISAELILTYPQRMNVSVDGVGIGDIGHVDALPPTLTAQYHFLPALKYAWISYDLKSNGSKVSTLTVDPWLFGFGVGYRF
jgi:outer membrane protein